MQPLAANEEEGRAPPPQAHKCVLRSRRSGDIKLQIANLLVMKIILGRFTTRAEWLRKQNNAGIGYTRVPVNDFTGRQRTATDNEGCHSYDGEQSCNHGIVRLPSARRNSVCCPG